MILGYLSTIQALLVDNINRIEFIVSFHGVFRDLSSTRFVYSFIVSALPIQNQCELF